MSIFRVGHVFEERVRDDGMGCLSLCENESLATLNSSP